MESTQLPYLSAPIYTELFVCKVHFHFTPTIATFQIVKVDLSFRLHDGSGFDHMCMVIDLLAFDC